jgi:protein involved in polysaccharide export with SLBB domain
LVKQVWRLIIAVAVLSVAACGGNAYNTVPMTASSVAGYDAGKAGLDKPGDFTLGSGDKIRVTIFGADQLSGEYDVDLGGSISLPLIGPVPAAGKTLDQVKIAITQRLREKNLMNDPQVSTAMVSARPFYILGEVQKPGEYPYHGGLNIISAIATASGFTYRADQDYVFVRRAGQPDEIKVPLASALPLGPGDIVRIPSREF